MNVEEAGAEEEEGDMDWNVNSKIMLEHLTSAFSSSGDRPLSLNNLTHGKKEVRLPVCSTRSWCCNAHEYLKVDQMTAFSGVRSPRVRRLPRLDFQNFEGVRF